MVGRLTVSDPAALTLGQAMHVVTEELPEVGTDLGVRSGSIGARMSTGVEIAGVGLHPFGRFGDTTATALGVTAVRAALADVGWDASEARSRIGAAFCATAYGGVAAGHRVLGALALTGMPIIDVEAGCASGGAALALGAAAIAAGEHDAVLVVGVEKMPKGIIRSSFFAPWQEQAGLAATPAYFALPGAAHDARARADHRRSRRAGGEEPPLGSRQPRRHVPQPRSRPRRCWRRGWSASRCTCGCSARRTRAQPPSCCGAERGGVQLAAAALRSHLPGSVLDESTPMAGLVDDSAITPPTHARRRPTPTRRPASGPTTSTSSSARTPTPPASCCRGTSSACARAGEQRSSSPTDGAAGLGRRQPLGRAAVQGRAARRVGARPGGRAGPPAPRRLRRAPGRRAPAVGLAHTIGRGANASVTIVTR